MHTNIPQIEDDFESLDARRHVLPVQGVYVMYFLGLLAFAGVVVYLSGSHHAAERPSRADRGLVDLLSAATAAATAVGLLAAWYVPAMLLAPQRLAGRAARLQQRGRLGTLATECFRRMFTARIVRLCCLDAASMVGLLTCLLGAINGAIRARPAYWWNVAPAAATAAYLAVTFPTRGRLTANQRELVDAVRRRLDEPQPTL